MAARGKKGPSHKKPPVIAALLCFALLVFFFFSPLERRKRKIGSPEGSAAAAKTPHTFVIISYSGVRSSGNSRWRDAKISGNNIS